MDCSRHTRSPSELRPRYVFEGVREDVSHAASSVPTQGKPKGLEQQQEDDGGDDAPPGWDREEEEAAPPPVRDGGGGGGGGDDDDDDDDDGMPALDNPDND
jgi:hypothetical protein